MKTSMKVELEDKFDVYVPVSQREMLLNQLRNSAIKMKLITQCYSLTTNHRLRRTLPLVWVDKYQCSRACGEQRYDLCVKFDRKAGGRYELETEIAHEDYQAMLHGGDDYIIGRKTRFVLPLKVDESWISGIIRKIRGRELFLEIDVYEKTDGDRSYWRVHAEVEFHPDEGRVPYHITSLTDCECAITTSDQASMSAFDVIKEMNDRKF